MQKWSKTRGTSDWWTRYLAHDLPVDFGSQLSDEDVAFGDAVMASTFEPYPHLDPEVGDFGPAAR